MAAERKIKLVMKSIWIIAFLALALFVTALAEPPQAQSQPEPQQQQVSTPNVGQILEKYIDALGGKAAIQKISSRASIGVIKVSGVSLSGTVEIYEKAPNKRLVIMKMAGFGAMRKGFNGTVGWIEEPLSDGPRELSGRELAAIDRDADFYKSIRLRELYPRIMFKGMEKVGDRETYSLEAPRAGSPKRWYFDAQTGLLTRTTSEENSPEGKVINEEFYEDYKTLDGILVPFIIRQSGEDDVTIRLTEVKHNVAIDDSIFNKPAALSDRATSVVSGPGAADKSARVIPFELYDNHIYLPVRVNGSEPLKFVLDTGAAVSLINERRAKQLSIKMSDTGEVINPDNEKWRAKLHLTQDVSFNMAGAETFAKQVAVVSFDPLESILGRRFDGLLGFELLNRYVVEIDYVAKTITLHDPKSFRFSGNGEAVPLRLVDKLPVIRAGIKLAGRDTIEGEFEIDTGMRTAVALHTPFVNRHKMLSTGQKVFPSIGISASGESEMAVGRIQRIQIGRYAIESPIAEYSQATRGPLARDTYAGIIGGEILRRFKVILDYSRNRMILEPNSHIGDPSEHDMSGAFLVAEGENLKTIKVHRVFENSPASQAGLRQGDIITAIDGRAASELTLDQIGQLFKREGRKYLLRIKRGKHLLRIRVKMARLI